MESNIVKPEGSRPIVIDSLEMYELFRDWTRDITNQVNFDSLITGSGSPEDVVTALKNRQYFDDTGAAGNNRYTKQVDDIAGDKKKGWILS